MRESPEITSRLRNRRAAIAWLVAYALFFQALATSFIDALELWDFNSSASICSSGASDHSQDGPSSPVGHDHRGCCVLCGTPGLAATDIGVAEVMSAPLTHGPLLKPFNIVSVSSVVAGQPCQPRAPPLVV